MGQGKLVLTGHAAEKVRSGVRPGEGTVLIRDPINGVGERFVLMYSSLFS